MLFTSPRVYFRDLYVLTSCVGGLGVILYLWWYTFGTIPATTKQVYLHYNIVFGIDKYGPRSTLLVPLLFGTGVLIVNMLWSFLFYKSDRTVARMIVVITLFVILFLLIGLRFIVGLNI